MSGEIVLAPLFFNPVTGAVIGAVTVAYTVSKLIEAQQNKARQKAQEQKERIVAWQQYQNKQSDEREAKHHALEAVKETQEVLLATGLQEVTVEARSTSSLATNYVKQDPPLLPAGDRANMQLGQISELFEKVPASQFEDEKSAFSRLKHYHERISHRLEKLEIPTQEEVSSLQLTVQQTLDAYIKDAELEASRQLVRQEALELLLDSILQYQYFEITSCQEDELQVLEQQLMKAISTDAISAGVIDLLQKRFNTIKQAIDQNMQYEQMSLHLTDSVCLHLDNMGYSLVETFQDYRLGEARQAMFSMPGGERIRIVLQADFKLGFQMVHEADEKNKKGLTEQELALFRDQEKQWCKDMKALIRNLIKDGIPYEVLFERDMLDDSIPVVVLESIDEILNGEDEEDEVLRRKRKHTKKRDLE